MNLLWDVYNEELKTRYAHYQIGPHFWLIAQCDARAELETPCVTFREQEPGVGWAIYTEQWPRYEDFLAVMMEEVPYTGPGPLHHAQAFFTSATEARAYCDEILADPVAFAMRELL